MPPRFRDRWRARPLMATGLRLLTILLPVAASLGATIVVRPLLPSPHGWVRDVAWWGTLVVVIGVVAGAVDRLGRRLLPLVMLLKLSMLFPDRAPSRFAVARHAGSVRKLRARLAEIEREPEAATESASAATILALATALQTHDRKTRGHSERVRVYTDLLAEELGLSRDDRYRLRWAALLHDIGKLRVKAEILNKPGKLNKKEWEVIRRHPAEGARIAAPLLEWLGPWAGAITQHHERFEGGGYPAGLGGEEISHGGRIVSVADAYDTMTAVRSYKKPVAVRAAREELARCSPSQFDPSVVRTFFNISLPRLMWKTGPVSFLFTVPYLAALQQVGKQSLEAARGAAAAAAVAGAVTGGSHGPFRDAPALPEGPAARPAVSSPAPVSAIPMAYLGEIGPGGPNVSGTQPRPASPTAAPAPVTSTRATTSGKKGPSKSQATDHTATASSVLSSKTKQGQGGSRGAPKDTLPGQAGG